MGLGGSTSSPVSLILPSLLHCPQEYAWDSSSPVWLGSRAGAKGTGKRAAAGDGSRGREGQGESRPRAAHGPGVLSTDSPFLSWFPKLPLSQWEWHHIQAQVNQGQPSLPSYLYRAIRKREEEQSSKADEVGGDRLSSPLRAQWTRVPSLPFLEEAHLLPANKQEPLMLVTGTLASCYVDTVIIYL